MQVEFDETQLVHYSKILEQNAFAPTSLFKEHFGLPSNVSIPVDDVEDFMIAFYSTYNMTLGKKY